jgi:hypothetical protein
LSEYRQNETGKKEAEEDIKFKQPASKILLPFRQTHCIAGMEIGNH